MNAFARYAVQLFVILSALALGACDDGESSGDTGTGGSAGSGGSGGQAGGGATGGTGGGLGGVGGGTGGQGGQDLGPPIEAPLGQWTWVPFEDAFCANGTTTGIGVNLSDQDDRVVIFLMGGGACWSYFTCYTLGIAANLQGYNEQSFNAEAPSLATTSLFDRNDPNNPLKDASYVYVPYCTGDVHAGDHISTYSGIETRHVGHANLRAYLKRLTPTFPEAGRVLLTGVSAGGFGAGFGWDLVQNAFGPVRVDMLDDSGPPLPNPYLSESLEQDWRTEWGLNATLPSDCTGCAEDIDALFAYYGSKYPNNRGALISYLQDETIAFYFQITGPEVAAGLGELAQSAFGYPQMSYYFVTGTNHVLLTNPYGISQNGVTLMDWLVQMLDDDPSWTSISP